MSLIVDNNKQVTPTQVHHLPLELLDQILSQLGLDALASLSRTSREFQSVVNGFISRHFTSLQGMPESVQRFLTIYPCIENLMPWTSPSFQLGIRIFKTCQSISQTVFRLGKSETPESPFKQTSQIYRQVLRRGLPAPLESSFNQPATAFLSLTETALSTEYIPIKPERDQALVFAWPFFHQELDKLPHIGELPSKTASPDAIRLWISLHSDRMGELTVLNIENKKPLRQGFQSLNLEVLPELLLCKNLRELSITGANLRQLPTFIGTLTQLKKLNLSDNMLETLPTSIGNLVNLEELYINKNVLFTTIPPEIGNLTKLRVLEIGGPENNFSLMNVTPSMHIQGGSEVFSVPTEICQLKSLESLKILGSPDAIFTVPTEIAGLTHLKTLCLAGNIANVPVELGRLTQLQSLGLLSPQINMMPVELENLQNLEELVMLSGITPNMGCRLSNFKNLHSLNILRLDATLDDEIALCTHLRRLSLMTLEPSPVPAYIAALHSLKELHLDGVFQLGCSLKCAKHIEKLTIGYYSPSDPEEVSDALAYLKDFDSLTELSIGLAHKHDSIDWSVLTKLEKLSIRYDRPDYFEADGGFSISPQIGTLSSLKELTVLGAESLPREIQDCTNLEVLRLTNGVLSDFPTELINLPNLRVIDLSGNRHSESIPLREGVLWFEMRKTNPNLTIQEMLEYFTGQTASKGIQFIL